MRGFLLFNFIVCEHAIFNVLHLGWSANDAKYQCFAPSGFFDHTRDRSGSHYVAILQANEDLVSV